MKRGTWYCNETTRHWGPSLPEQKKNTTDPAELIERLRKLANSIDGTKRRHCDDLLSELLFAADELERLAAENQIFWEIAEMIAAEDALYDQDADECDILKESEMIRGQIREALAKLPTRGTEK